MTRDDQYEAPVPVVDTVPGPARALGHLATIRIQYDGQRPARAVVTGELDLGCAADLTAALREAVTAAENGLDLDLLGVAFCDVSTLRCLLNVRMFARAVGRGFTLGPYSRAVARILELTGTQSLFTPSCGIRNT